MSNTLIVPRNTRVEGESCGNCRFGHTDETREFVCRRNPPQATVLMVPAPPPRTGFEPHPFCTFPYTRKQDWCGAWERSKKTTSD